MLNKAAADALYPAIATSHEALYLLSQAAGQTEEAGRQTSQSGGSILRSPSSTFGSPASANTSHHRHLSNNLVQNAMIDPAMGHENGHDVESIESTEFQNALKTWSRMRFVRAGWFTHREAMAYIE